MAMASTVRLIKQTIELGVNIREVIPSLHLNCLQTHWDEQVELFQQIDSLGMTAFRCKMTTARKSPHANEVNQEEKTLLPYSIELWHTVTWLPLWGRLHMTQLVILHKQQDLGIMNVFLTSLQSWHIRSYWSKFVACCNYWPQTPSL